MSSADHPFYASSYRGRPLFHMTVEDRIAAARQFDAATCRRALALDDLLRAATEAKA